MSFVQVGNVYVNMDKVRWVSFHETPELIRHGVYDYGTILFKPGETLSIRDEESLKQVKYALGIPGSRDEMPDFIGVVGSTTVNQFDEELPSWFKK